MQTGYTLAGILFKRLSPSAIARRPGYGMHATVERQSNIIQRLLQKWLTDYVELKCTGEGIRECAHACALMRVRKTE